MIGHRRHFFDGVDAGALLRGEGGFVLLDNIKIILADATGAVVAVPQKGQGLLRFTSVPAEAARHFQDVLAANG